MIKATAWCTRLFPVCDIKFLPFFPMPCTQLCRVILSGIEWFDFLKFCWNIFYGKPFASESRMVHFIGIGCAQNCHKAWENWTQIGLFGAVGGEILKKLISSNSRPKIISLEPNEYLLSLLRNWEMSKAHFLGKKSIVL